MDIIRTLSIGNANTKYWNRVKSYSKRSYKTNWNNKYMYTTYDATYFSLRTIHITVSVSGVPSICNRPIYWPKRWAMSYKRFSTVCFSFRVFLIRYYSPQLYTVYLVNSRSAVVCYENLVGHFDYVRWSRKRVRTFNSLVPSRCGSNF